MNPLPVNPSINSAQIQSVMGEIRELALKNNDDKCISHFLEVIYHLRVIQRYLQLNEKKRGIYYD